MPSQERVFIIITNHQLGLPVGLGTRVSREIIQLNEAFIKN